MARSQKVPYYIYGTDGPDVLHGNNRANEIWGGGGDDIIYLYGGNDRGVGSGGNDIIYGGDGADWLQGQEGADLLYGESGADELWGMKGEDRLYGGTGNDLIWGGADRDILYGGPGADIFKYVSHWESTTRVYDGSHDGVPGYDPEWEHVVGDDPSTPWLESVDLIADFESGIDKIDLGPLDADLTTPVVTSWKGSTGNDAFRLVAQPTGQPGELTVTYDAASNLTTIHGYMDGDLIPDLTITVSGTINPTVDIIF